MALRWFLVSAQYRQPINYTTEALQSATVRLYHICETLDSTAQVLSDSGTTTVLLCAPVVAMDHALTPHEYSVARVTRSVACTGTM
jgi:cysteinyl-tRNA synthetase